MDNNPQLSGIQFPHDGSGRRSTKPAVKGILAAALRVLDPAAARAVNQEPEWRTDYPPHIRALVAAQAAAPEAVLESCQAGIDEAWSVMPFLRDGRDCALADAMLQPQPGALATLTQRGAGDAAVAPWFVPYRGKLLTGDALLRQIERWEKRGICEPSHAQALRDCLANPAWFDLSDRHLVLLGAGSEAGPLAWLARWRANIVAVDLPRPAVWKRITRQIEQGNACLIAPVVAPGAGDLQRAGADLLTQTPEIAEWLRGLGQVLDIGNIAYLDGERHVRVSLAMDAISAMLCRHEMRTTLAYMATPTDIFAVPQVLATQVQQAFAKRGVLKRLAQAGVRAGSGGKTFLPHIESLIDAGIGGQRGVVDAMVVEQGPNYALAKRLQQWRAIVARAAGHRVALNVAPSTNTVSVTKNPVLAAGFRGARAFNCEVFEPATTNALMAAMWVHDLRNPRSAANPAVVLSHPLDLITAGANHGGLWRVPYLPRSVLPLAALLGLVAPRA